MLPGNLTVTATELDGLLQMATAYPEKIIALEYGEAAADQIIAAGPA
jgi:hypothetical protein